MELKTIVHRRVHTNLYYALVNTVVVYAYESAGDDEIKARQNVDIALGSVKVFLLGLNTLSG